MGDPENAGHLSPWQEAAGHEIIPDTQNDGCANQATTGLVAANGYGAGRRNPPPCQPIPAPGGFLLYQAPVLGMLVHGSAGASAPPACSSSIEMPSGVRMKAMRPSRGGRLIVTPCVMKALQVS